MKMKDWLVAGLILLGTSLGAQPKGDLCHVYLIDVVAAEKTLEKTDDPEILKKAVRIFPSFETEISEEVFTTRHYPIPQSNLKVTASVYYTDESMASKAGENGEINPESMLLGIAVTGKEEENAIFKVSGNAVAEAGYDDSLSKVRVKKYFHINQKLYLAGLECDCNAKREKRK